VVRNTQTCAAGLVAIVDVSLGMLSTETQYDYISFFGGTNTTLSSTSLSVENQLTVPWSGEGPSSPDQRKVRAAGALSVLFHTDGGTGTLLRLFLYQKIYFF
jgi:hypothetical protein